MQTTLCGMPPHLCPRNGLPLILHPFVEHPTLDDSSRSSKRKAYWPTWTVSKGIKVGAAGRGQRGACPTLGHQKSLDNVGFSTPRAFNSATLSSASFSFDSGRVHDKRSRMATCVGKCKQHGHHGPPKPTLLKVFMVKNLVFRWPKHAKTIIFYDFGGSWYIFPSRQAFAYETKNMRISLLANSPMTSFQSHKKSETKYHLKFNIAPEKLPSQ